MVASFSFVSREDTPSGPKIKYMTRMYKASPVISIKRFSGYTALTTLDRTYLLHGGHALTSPISEKEVRSTGVACEDCALLVYLDHHTYMCVGPGKIVCQQDGDTARYTLEAGQTLSLGEEDTCSNEAVLIGRTLLRIQEYKLDATGDKTVDALLQRKVKQADTMVETMASMKASHMALNMKLRQEVTAAQEDISTFVQDTNQNLQGFQITTGVSLGGLAVVAAIMTAIVSCIMCRCLAMRKERHVAAVNDITMA